ncbi:MAG: TIR domain-containing protein [Ignavibacteria bacterium]|nr:TIR domain-containing protein [Ignavibacteria bacterium]
MSKQIDLIKLLISKGKIKNAISELSKILKSEEKDDLENDLTSLSARFNKNEKQKRIGVISETDYNLEWRRILDALTSLVQEHQENTGQLDSKNIVKPTKDSSRTVFISYNHKDQESVFKLKDALKSNGIIVIIDADSMRAGDAIKEFIEESIAISNITLSVISNASLLSGWVGMETINTFFAVKIKKDRKFIACFLDDDFFNKEFTLKAVDKIDQDISKIEHLMLEYSEKKLDTGDLNTEKTRLYDLRNNLDKIIGKLRDSLCIDIRGEQFEQNLPKILEAINVAD